MGVQDAAAPFGGRRGGSRDALRVTQRSRFRVFFNWFEKPYPQKSCTQISTAALFEVAPNRRQSRRPAVGERSRRPHCRAECHAVADEVPALRRAARVSGGSAQRPA